MKKGNIITKHGERLNTFINDALRAGFGLAPRAALSPPLRRPPVQLQAQPVRFR